MPKQPKKDPKAPKKARRVPVPSVPPLNPAAPVAPKVPGRPRVPKVREDMNQLAHRIVAEATGQAPKTPDPDAGKDPAAVALGRKGGLKGGKARAKKLTKAQRTEIAKKAAAVRWAKPADR
jgi:hypothetical protein